MRWWQFLILGLDLYFLGSLGPWMLLRILEWSLLQSRRSLAEAGARLSELAAAFEQQHHAWPPLPRAGRYEQHDRLAIEALSRLSAALTQAQTLWASLADYAARPLGLVDVLLLRTYRPLAQTLRAWRQARELHQLLAHADDDLAIVFEQQHIVEDLPARARAALTETRAELQRMSAVLETEQDLGTVGLEDIEQRLQTLGLDVEQGLDALAHADDEQLPLVIVEVDELLAETTPSLSELDHLLEQSATERSKAQNQIMRLESAQRLARERWEGLRARGATEPDIEQRLARLRTGTDTVARTAQVRTLEAYRQANAQIADLDADIRVLMAQLDALDHLMIRSKEAVEGDVQGLVEIEEFCHQVAQRDAQVEPDHSLALVAQASDLFREAERERALGTMQSYEHAIELSSRATDLLDEAEAATNALPEQVQRVRELWQVSEPALLDELRLQAQQMAEEFQTYAWHWQARASTQMDLVVARLQEVEAARELLPIALREQGKIRQSEVEETLQTLEAAAAGVDEVDREIGKLDAELRRVEGLRGRLERGLEELERKTLPALEELAPRMLPERRDHLDALLDRVRGEIAALADRSQVNYDEAVGQWLPQTLRQVDEVRAAHEASVREHRDALASALQEIEREWTRLQRLNPQDPPGPDENIERLASDLDDWRAEAERQAENPPALHDLLGRRVAALVQRLEAAQQQLVEGRRNLLTLDRRYQKLSQSVRALRAELRDRQRASRWTHLVWDTEEAEAVWEKAQDLERSSRAAATLNEANDLLQASLNATSQAETLFARTQHQMVDALARLDDELRWITSVSQRARKHATELQARGEADAANDIQEQCREAQHSTELAEQATSFEEALRYLRNARNRLAKL